MDPNEALERLRAAIQRYHVATEMRDHDEDRLGEAEQVIEHAQALDEWLSRKGFLPRDWQGQADLPRDPHAMYAEGETWQSLVDELNRETEPDPLGGPHPGVTGHLPEHADE
jgi:hypothetical protein